MKKRHFTPQWDTSPPVRHFIPSETLHPQWDTSSPVRHHHPVRHFTPVRHFNPSETLHPQWDTTTQWDTSPQWDTSTPVRHFTPSETPPPSETLHPSEILQPQWAITKSQCPRMIATMIKLLGRVQYSKVMTLFASNIWQAQFLMSNLLVLLLVLWRCRCCYRRRTLRSLSVAVGEVLCRLPLERLTAVHRPRRQRQETGENESSE